MTAPHVSLVDVRHRYGDEVVLSLDRLVLPLGATAILGPNGAGKSTLLRLIATLLTAGEGTVSVDGHDLADPERRLALRRRLGYAGQLDDLPARMRVAEYCDYVGALKEIGPRRRRLTRTADVLRTVGLADQCRDRIGTLSGGMRRRLVLAQALLGDPELLVLDEPLVSLDSEHRSTIIRSIVGGGSDRTTVIATHLADEMASVCDHVVVLAAGLVAFEGSPTALIARASGRVFETATPIEHASARAVAPGRFRVVGWQPPAAEPVEPTVHDGYLAVLNAQAFPAP